MSATTCASARTDIFELIQPVPGSLADYRPRQRYLLIDEVRIAEAGPLPQRNLSAALFQLEGSHGPAEVLELLHALAVWLRAPEQSGLRRAFTVWLKRVFLPRRMPGVDFDQLEDLNEVRGMLAERIETWPEQWERQGIEKGMQKGLQQGVQKERLLLVRMVRKRFGPDLANQSQPLLEAVADSQTLEDLAETLLDSADGAAWLQALQKAAG